MFPWRVHVRWAYNIFKFVTIIQLFALNLAEKGVFVTKKYKALYKLAIALQREEKELRIQETFSELGLGTFH